MNQGMRATNLDGWTLLSIWRTSETKRVLAGAFVLLLQENSEMASISCSLCASGERVHQLFVMILPLSRTLGPVTVDGAWLALCTTCSIGLIDGWRSGRH